MTDNFVIDENILYDAWRGKDNNGRKIFTDRAFVYSFLDSDKKLAMTPFIRDRYYFVSEQTLGDKEFVDVTIIPSFMQRVADGGKTNLCTGLTPNYTHIKQGDDEFVCVSIFVDGNLVTKDGRLKKEIEEEGLKDQVNLCDVSQAISLIHEN